MADRAVQVVVGFHGAALGLSLLHGGSVSAQLLDGLGMRSTIAAAVLFFGIAQILTSRIESAQRRLIVCAGETGIWATFLSIFLLNGAFTPSLYQGGVSLGVNLWLCWHFLKDPYD